MAANPSKETATIISLKLLVDKSSNKVVFAETGKEFVDFLFGLLQVPLGSIIALLRDYYLAAGPGSLGRVHESIENLDPSYLLPNQTKGSLLNPKPAFQSSTLTPPLLQNFFSPNQEIMVVSFGRDSKYRRRPSRRAKGVPNNTEKGYVRGVVTYLVMDNLTVKPMSTISSITLLNTLNIKDMGSVQEKKVKIDINKGLELIKVSLYSTTVLTDVFLGHRK
ncbi:uncharacterized protein LOC122294729 [Carya illinoinensis]|uniref:DUF674 domain-containing protein n=1 Tax=Carya illinoinensis TaxID=32201 RepID=A0A8T1NBT5_CARIL|nr:uncharacterized protein LOC122294729 [Carya illinoinensis]KAG6629216.1 hypothetical protein CIPAW_14G069100 [Carya illinoinensis]KAG6678272.1 hypothetical protein I3842_14G071500 [Carya illinoinensis]